MKKNISTEKVTPWVVKPEAVEQSVYEHEKDQQQEQDRLFRGAQLYDSRHGKSIAEELLSVADAIREGESCSEDNVVFCAGACEEAAEYISFVADCQRKQDLRDKKSKIADLCKEKAPKNPEDLLAELDMAMGRVLSGEGDSLAIAESIGCAMDLIAQGMLHKDLPQVEEEDFELPNILRDVAEMLECGDETHPQNRQIALDAAWMILDHLGWKSKFPPSTRIDNDTLSLVEAKLQEMDNIAYQLSRANLRDDQLKMVLGLAESIWTVSATLFPHKSPEEA